MKNFAETLAEFQASPMADCVRPAEAYHRESARTLCQWAALDSLGYVRLRIESDPDYDPTDYDDDDHSDPADWEAYGSIGEFIRPDHLAEFRDAFPQYPHMSDENWEVAGSVWGHVGYRDVMDWRENVYIIGIMRETIDAFRLAWKERVHAKEATR